MAKRSKNRLRGKIVQLAKGLAIYQTGRSPYWYARVRDPVRGKFKVTSTKETSKLEARRVAQELAHKAFVGAPVLQQYTFKYYATKFIEESNQAVAEGARNATYARTMKLALDNRDWGLMPAFGRRDVRELRTHDYIKFMKALKIKRPDLASSTLNTIMVTFRNVLKVALNEGVIDVVPDTPRPPSSDNPRPFFRFEPLIAKPDDEYKKLLKTAKQLAVDKVIVRGLLVTPELYDLIMFCVHSFVRPTTTELYSIRHRDVAVAYDPKRLMLTIPKGKTGHRVSSTMKDAVGVYERIKLRYPNASPDDFIFLPDYPNRETASRIIQRQFNEVLQRAGLKLDPTTGEARSVYSLRHTALCMRLVNSEGEVNIFTLAKNAGTSVEQIERFYVKHLPSTPGLIRNLQSSGRPKKPLPTAT